MTALPSAEDMTAWRELVRLSRRLVETPAAKARALTAACRAARRAVMPPNAQDACLSLLGLANRYTGMLTSERLAAGDELLAACAALEPLLNLHEERRGGKFTRACIRSEDQADARRRVDLEGPF